MHESEKWKWSCSVVSDAWRPHGLQPTRLLCPWDFQGKSTGVGCHILLQGIFLTQESNPGRQILYHWATSEAQVRINLNQNRKKKRSHGIFNNEILLCKYFVDMEWDSSIDGSETWMHCLKLLEISGHWWGLKRSLFVSMRVFIVSRNIWTTYSIFIMKHLV